MGTDYTFQPETISGNNIAVAEAENATASFANAHAWTSATDGDAGGGITMKVLPDNGTAWVLGASAMADGAPRLDFDFNITTAGTYWLYLRSAGIDTSSDSCWFKIGSATEAIHTPINSANDLRWSRAGSASLSTGVVTVRIAAREDGYVLDRILLSTNGSQSGLGLNGDGVIGPAESAHTGGGAPAQNAQHNNLRNIRMAP